MFIPTQLDPEFVNMFYLASFKARTPKLVHSRTKRKVSFA